jgi:cysteinyl-tRNA synthetase
VGKPEKAFREAVLEALADDLNISKALAAVDEMVAAANEGLDADPKNKALKQSTLGNIAWLAEVLGIGGKDAYRWFQLGLSDEEIARIESLIEARTEAKKRKDFAAADAIREELTAMGVQLMDTPQGTVWEKAE